MPALPQPADAASTLPTTHLSTLARRTPQLLSALTQRLCTRQSSGSGTIVAIPAVYAGINDGPSPGVVVAIVLGSVAGFLLLIYLLWALSTGGGFFRSTVYEEESVVEVSRRRRSRSPGHSRRSGAPRSPRRDRVIRHERIVRDVPVPREMSRVRNIIVEEARPPPMERRVTGDDVVEVIEEYSEIGIPPPNRKSRRDSSYRRGDYSDI